MKNEKQQFVFLKKNSSVRQFAQMS